MKPPAAPTPPDSSLSAILPILDAFNHRHRNQHRASHWWPVFRITRRAARALSSDLRSRPSAPSFAPPSAHWLAAHVVPRAYMHVFPPPLPPNAHLAADNQHAPLGLLLLAVLARIHAVLADILPPPPDQVPARRSQTSPAATSIPPRPQHPEKLHRNDDDDDDDDDDDKPRKSASADAGATPKEINNNNNNNNTIKKKKKKAKKGDELAGLFASLG
ncbi:hypothetical protein ESCO_004598 [Escovopsis weberi]|uniref:RNase MRP protein 1 RNA binding domain-containing protein n=1 Tax=Escovopsis weberi TaxID=150374 RepID=A0A0M8MZ44_ESCWE|nr:hypothetical protein ESCO_004598 [Escovopsis weberi]